MFQNVSSIHHTPHLEQKCEISEVDPLVGSLQNREVRKTPCEKFKETIDIFKNFLYPPSPPPPPKLSNYFFDLFSSSALRINEEAINSLTDTCIEELKLAPLNHSESIKNWVIQIYKAHDIHIFSDRGGHMMDVYSQIEADDSLNPILLQKIENLFPYSSKAFNLKLEATDQDKPLSYLIFKREFNE